MLILAQNEQKASKKKELKSKDFCVLTRNL
jgi:hypothetical protein